MSEMVNAISDAADAIVLAAATTGNIRKGDLFEAISKLAIHHKQTGESDAQAFVRYCESDAVGRALAKIYRETPNESYAKRLDRVEKAARRPVVRWASPSEPNNDDGLSPDNSDAGSADARINAMADVHQKKNPELSHAQAVDHIITKTPQGRELFHQSLSEARQKNGS